MSGRSRSGSVSSTGPVRASLRPSSGWASPCLPMPSFTTSRPRWGRPRPPWVATEPAGSPPTPRAGPRCWRRLPRDSGEGAGGAAAGVLGVTVLTSLDDNVLRTVGLDRSAGQLVSSLARVADRAGCEGVVCSPKELQVVADVAPRLARFTPGIRSASGEDDQVRTASPEEALDRGADWIVIGRPITAAPDPPAAAAALAERIAGRHRPD